MDQIQQPVAPAEYLSVAERLSCDTGFKSGSSGFRQGRNLNFTELQREYNNMVKGMRKIKCSLQKLTSTKPGLIRNTDGPICTNFVETQFLWPWASATIEEPGAALIAVTLRQKCQPWKIQGLDKSRAF